MSHKSLIKWLYAIGRLTMLAGLILSLAACGQATATQVPEAEPAEGEHEEPLPPVSEEEEAKEEITLTFWHYFTDRADLFEEFSSEYEALTGVKVIMELYPGDTLGQKFQASAEADMLPDLSAAWAGVGNYAAYAKEGIVLNLTKYMDAGWADRFVPAHLAAASFIEGNQEGVEPGAYLVPLDANNMQILYNTQLFAEAGIVDTPTSWEELLEVGAKLHEKGIEPFVSGFGSWGVSAFAQPYLWNMIGAEDLEKTYSGEMPYTSQQWIDFLSIFVEMAESGILAEGILSYDFPAAESLFLNGQAAMIFDGSWAIGVFNQQDPTFDQYNVFLPPAVDGYDNPVYIPGGVGGMAFVVGTSPHTVEGVKFLQWLTEAEQQAHYATYSLNLPANVEVAGKVPMTDVLTSFAASMDRVPPSLAHTMKGAVETTMVAGIQRIIAGEDTPENVAGLMQLAHETDQAQ